MITIVYLDRDGLPRAWADGPKDSADEVNEVADNMLAAYIAKGGCRDTSKDSYTMEVKIA